MIFNVQKQYKADINQTQQDVDNLLKLKKELVGASKNKQYDAISKADISDDAKKIAKKSVKNNDYLDQKDIDNFGESAKNAAKESRALGVANQFAAMGTELLNAALNAGIMLVVSIAVQKLIEVLDSLIITFEEQSEIVQNLSQEYQDNLSQIDQIKQKLQENQSLIEQINSQPLNMVDEETKANLEAENKELQNQLALLEATSKFKKTALGEETITLLNKNSEQSTIFKQLASEAETSGDSFSAFVLKTTDFFYKTQGFKSSSKLEATQQQLDYLESLNNQLNSLDPSSENFADNQQRLQTEITNTSNALADNISFLSEQKQNLDLSTQAGQDYYNLITNLEKQTAAMAMGTTYEDMIESVGEKLSGDYTELLENLDFEELKIAYSLEDVGDLSWNELKDHIQEVKEQMSAPQTLEDWREQLLKYQDAARQAIEATDLYNRALQEQNETGSLSNKTVEEIIRNGYGAALVVDQETNAVTLNTHAYQELQKARINEQIAKLKQQQIDLTKQLSEEAAQVSYLAAVNYEEAISLYKKQAAKRGQLNEVNATIASLEAEKGNIGKFSPKTNPNPTNSSTSSVDTWLEAYNKEKSELDHQRKMGTISEEEYLNGLRALNDKYFKDKKKYQDKDWANQEEIRSLEQSLTKDKISDINDEISALEKEENTYDQQLDLVYQQRDAINDAIEDARAKGYDIESEYYKSLEKLMDENLEKEKSIIDAKREYEQKAFLEDIDTSKERISSYKESGHGEISGELMVEEAEQAMKAINERIEELRGEDSEANKEYIKELQEQYKDLYDSRLEGLQMILDAEKKQIDESISAAREALEKERKATEEYWNEEIKAYKRKHEAQEKVNTLKEKELQLENLKKQRNVLTYMEGQGFVYTADTEAVDAAQEDLDKTREEYEYQAQLQRMEDAKERALQAIDDELAKLDEQQEFWDRYFEDFELNSATAQSIHEDWVKNQGEQFVKQTDNIRIYSENYTKYLQDMIDKMRELNALEGNAKIKTELGGSSSSKERNSSKGYASGSAYVSNSGTYLVNENGPEAIFKPGLGTYEYLPQGTVVFSAAATKNLWNWSKLNPARTLSASRFPTVAAPQVNSISIGDVILNGVQDTDRLSREIVDRLPLAMQQEFYKR